jgi:hypothetical protein
MPTLLNNFTEHVKKLKRIILRNIYGSTFDNGVQRIKYNDELYSMYSLYKDPDIVRVIKVAKKR